MKNPNKAKLFILLSLALTSCSESTKQTQPIQNKDHTTEVASVPKISKDTNSIKSIENQTIEKHLLINGIKMKVVDFPLIKGSKLYNYVISSEGTIAGSIVVVATSSIIPEYFIQDYTYTEIAEATYRLVPREESQLLSLYKKLQKDEHFKTVELEIRYDGVLPNNRSKKVETF